MIFPVVMYRCECWTKKKAERQRINAFELWCWRRLLRVSWTARRCSSPQLDMTSCECPSTYHSQSGSGLKAWVRLQIWAGRELECLDRCAGSWQKPWERQDLSLRLDSACDLEYLTLWPGPQFQLPHGCGRTSMLYSSVVNFLACSLPGPLHVFCLSVLFWFGFFLLHLVACGILVLQPGIEPVPPAVAVWSLNGWTARSVWNHLVLASVFVSSNPSPGDHVKVTDSRWVSRSQVSRTV